MKEFDQQSDEELVKQAAAGSEPAMDYLFEKYKDMVKKQARSFYMPGADAEDLVQEGMIGLYHAICGYREEKGSSFSAFAHMVVNRQVMTAVKTANRLKNQPLNEYVSLDFEEKDEKNCNPEKIMIDKESISVLQYELVRGLSPMEKKVFELACKGYGYKEIAKQLHKTPKSVDNALVRIKSKYRKLRQ